MVVFVHIYVIVSLYFYTCIAAVNFPFQDPSLTWERRVNDLVTRLTVEEIANQTLVIGTQKPTNAVPRLGIKPYVWGTECLRGERLTNTTAFPQAIGLAAIWSQEHMLNVSTTIAREVRAHWNSYQKAGIPERTFGLSCYSPVINIARHPLWGRNQETYGECPYLSGSLVKSFVQGLQGSDSRYVQVSAGCKHFDVHGGPEDIPSSRFSFNSNVSSRDWRMTFLPAFKKCVEAGTYSLMCSYNSINGVPACANKQLLTSILREEWNFTGFVVSDAGAIENIQTRHKYTTNHVDTVTAAISAGCNMELGQSLIYLKQVDAVKQGKLTETQLRDNIKPMIYTRMKLGEFDPPNMNPYSSINMSVVQSVSHRSLAALSAEMSFTLLKNSNNALPLTGKVTNLALVGPFSNTKGYELFGDYSSYITPKFTTNVLQGLANLATNTRLAVGCNGTPCAKYDQSSVKLAVQGSDLVIVTLGTGIDIEKEGHDRSSLDLPGKQLDLLKDAVYYANGTKVILLLFNASPLDITWAKFSHKVHAILECYFPAQMTGVALYNSLTAATPDAIPAGRLPITWPAYLRQVPDITNYTMSGRTYRYYQGDPLYPFGYGLSYSQFFYSNLMVTPRNLSSLSRSIMVTVKVKNTGGYAADEVIQAYVSWPNIYQYITPKLQLVGFTRRRILRNQEITVILNINLEDIMVWLDENTRWRLLTGVMTVYVGGQQPNQRTPVNSNVLNATFTVSNRFY